MKILIAEDDPHILEGLAEIFQSEGYTTITAGNGADALNLYAQESPDFICLDVMMPEKSGYDVCREIRKTNQKIPVIFISAKSEEIDKVVGLELGADDYITKPFGVKEVAARIRSVTRRYLATSKAEESDTSFVMQDLEIFPNKLRAQRKDDSIDLSLRDIQILIILHQHQGQVIDRNTLFNKIWGLDHMPNSRTLDQHISQLRKKIELDPKNPTIIQTVHGAGYRYEN